MIQRLVLAAILLGAGCGGGGTEAREPREPTRAVTTTREEDPRAGCRDLAALELGEPVELIPGRLSLRAPRGATARSGAPESPSPRLPSVPEEGRIELVAGESALAILAFELFETGTDDLAASVRAQLGRQTTGDEVEEIAVEDAQLRVVGAVPSRASRDAAVFVLGTWVRHPDGTLLLVAFYASRAAVGERISACTAMARRIAATLTAGDRRLDRTGGERALWTLGGAELHLDVPADWVHDARAGPDFVVHRMRAVRPIGQGGVALGIYVGREPRSLATRATGARPPRPGTLFGRPVEWTTFAVGDAPARLAAEAMVPFPGEGSTAVVHVFAEAPDEAQLAETLRLAEGLRGPPPPPAPPPPAPRGRAPRAPSR